MRKILYAMVTGALLAGLLIGNACAAHIERLTESEDYQEVVDEALIVINDIGSWEDGKAAAEITEDQIEWSDCFKKYLDESDIFSESTESTTLEDMKEMMIAVWILPVQLDGVDSYVTIRQTKQGKWVGESISKEKVSPELLEEQLGQTGQDAEEILYVGGTGKMRSAFALMEQNDGSVNVQLLDEPVLTGEIGNTVSDAEEGNASLTVDDGSNLTAEPEQGTVYSFAEMASILNQFTVEETADDAAGDGGASTKDDTPAAGLIFVLVAVCGVGIFALRFGRKR